MQAASWGDDYQLLFTARPELPLPVQATPIGCVLSGSVLTLKDGANPVKLMPMLGYQHQ
jgi:thiamine-monophosphate kinase